MKRDKKIMMLAGNGFSTNVIYHAIDHHYGVHSVILEEKESTKQFLRRRIRKLGYFQTAGQLAFQALVVPVLRLSASKYINSIIQESGIKDEAIPHEKLTEVSSVNEQFVAQLIREVSPDIIVINGTRIISKKTLSVIQCPVINMHAGITPMYRGVHGAYWALINEDKDNCGVTVHLVDEGVDTGGILYQACLRINGKDNFVTYPVKQLALGLPLLIQAVEDGLAKTLSPFEKRGNSVQWYHPTIWKYLYHRFARGVK